ncbi:MAG: hypothetical protein R6V44_12985 [Paracoccaceae bacterium]
MSLQFGPATGKDWVDVLRAFLTPLVGIAAATFAALNYILATRRRHDGLFEKQYELYCEFTRFGEAVREACREITELEWSRVDIDAGEKQKRIWRGYDAEAFVMSGGLIIKSSMVFGDDFEGELRALIERESAKNWPSLSALYAGPEFASLVKKHMDRPK